MTEGFDNINIGLNLNINKLPKEIQEEIYFNFFFNITDFYSLSFYEGLS